MPTVQFIPKKQAPDAQQRPPTVQFIPKEPTAGPPDLPTTPTTPGPFLRRTPERLTRGDIAREAGIGAEGAPAGARFGFGLGSPVAREPEQQIELARRALGGEAEVRIGPETGELEFRMPGAEGFSLFNAPGLDLGDITGIAPETGVLATGMGGGVGGFAAGSTMGPAGAGVGTVAGEALGEGAAELVRLKVAAERGLIDLTPEQIVQEAGKRAGVAALGTVAGGAVLQGLRRVLANSMNIPIDLIDAVGDRPLNEAVEEARRLQQQVTSRTGEDFPLSVGQVSRSPEVLRAEEAAQTSRATGAGLGRMGEQQQTALDQLTRTTFGEPVTPQDRTMVGRELLQAGRRQVRGAEDAVSTTERQAFGTAATPEDAITQARRLVEEGRETVFAPLRQQFDQLQQEKDIRIDFSPVRSEAQRLRSEEGQDVLRSVSLQQQSRLLTEAEKAGMSEQELLELGSDNLLSWVKRDVDNPPTLGETQRALRDVRRELRRPSLADEPQRERILRRMEQSIVQARNQALAPEDLERVLTLERQFAEATSQLDRGIVGQFMRTDPRTGLAELKGEDAINQLLRGKEVAQEFVGALGSLPNSDAALMRTQDGILGMIQRRFVDDDTGRIDPNRLRTFLRNNRDSLEVLFQGRPEMVENLDNARSAAAALNRAEQTLGSMRSRMERLLGFETTDPARLASRVLSEVGPRDARVARRLLPENRRELFDRSLASNVYDALTSQGRLDARKIDEFLQSDRSQVTTAVLGERFNTNLGVIRDAMQQIDRATEGPVPLDLSSAFARGTPALQGVLRFARVPFAPLSARGRALTASLGVASDRTQQRLAEAMQDPEKLSALAGLARVSVGTKAAERLLGRLGFEAYLEAAQDDPLQGEEEAPPPADTNPQRGTLSP